MCSDLVLWYHFNLGLFFSLGCPGGCHNNECHFTPTINCRANGSKNRITTVIFVSASSHPYGGWNGNHERAVELLFKYVVVCVFLCLFIIIIIDLFWFPTLPKPVPMYYPAQWDGLSSGYAHAVFSHAPMRR